MSHGLGIALTVTGVIIGFAVWASYIIGVQRKRHAASKPEAVPPKPAVPAEWEAIASEITAARRDCKWCQPGVPLSVAMPQDCGCKRDCGVPYCQRRQAVAERGLA